MDNFIYKTGKAHIALKENGYYVWDSSVMKAQNGKYYMFASRWKEEYTFKGATYVVGIKLERK